MMILTLVLLLYLDLVAIGALLEQQRDPWTTFFAYVWLVLVALAVGLVGSLQGLGWAAFESAWADTRGAGGIRKGLELLGGRPSFGLAGASLLRLLSGACLLFGGLTWFLRLALEHGWFERWDAKVCVLLLVHWFRLSSLGLAGAIWAPLTAVVTGLHKPSILVHMGLAMAGSLLGWWVLWDALHVELGLEFWRMCMYCMAWFPTYGVALLWGAALWWLPSKLSSR